MDTLRIALLIIGALIILMIYLLYRRRDANPFNVQQLFQRLPVASVKEMINRHKQSEEDTPPQGMRAPHFDAESLEEFDEIIPQRKPDAVEALDLEDINLHLPDDAVVDGIELLIIFTIMAGKGKQFSGPDILEAVNGVGMQHGRMKIFHYYPTGQQTGANKSVCSLANIIEPGNFDLTQMEETSTPGLSLFMQLPGPMEAREAFAQTLDIGRQLAAELEGELCDETHSVLTNQTISHLKEEVEAFRFKQQMAQVKKHRN